MGIFVEEAAAFIIGGVIGAAVLYQKDMYNADKVRFILFCGCLLLALIGVLDVIFDHVTTDTGGPQQATP